MSHWLWYNASAHDFCPFVLWPSSEHACASFFLTVDCTDFVGNIISIFQSYLAGSQQNRQWVAKSDLDSAVLLARCLHLFFSLSPVLLGWHYSNCDGMIWHPVTTTLHVYFSWKTDKLLWLPIRKHIKYKVACMCFSVINGSGPAYLSELLHVYTLSRTLCSFSDTCMLKIQQYKCKTHGFRTVSCFGPHIWKTRRKLVSW